MKFAGFIKKNIVNLIISLKSCGLILNILNIYTIFIIMRYKSIYSVLLIIGVFITPFIKDYSKIAKMLIPLYIIPIILELMTLYIYNIEDNMKNNINFSFKTIFAFQQVNIQLEYLFLMIHYAISIYFIKKASMILKKNSLVMRILEKRLNIKNPSFWFIFKTIIINYTDLVSLFILFWISLYTVNLIHSVLVCFFFIYLLIKVNYVPQANKSKFSSSNSSPQIVTKNEKSQWSFYEIKLIYWRILVGYLEFIILFK